MTLEIPVIDFKWHLSSFSMVNTKLTSGRLIIEALWKTPKNIKSTAGKKVPVLAV